MLKTGRVRWGMCRSFLNWPRNFSLSLNLFQNKSFLYWDSKYEKAFTDLQLVLYDWCEWHERESSELWRRKSNWSKFLRRLVPAEKCERHPESHAKESSAGTHRGCRESSAALRRWARPGTEGWAVDQLGGDHSASDKRRPGGQELRNGKKITATVLGCRLTRKVEAAGGFWLGKLVRWWLETPKQSLEMQREAPEERMSSGLARRRLMCTWEIQGEARRTQQSGHETPTLMSSECRCFGL